MLFSSEHAFPVGIIIAAASEIMKETLMKLTATLAVVMVGTALAGISGDLFPDYRGRCKLTENLPMI